MPKIVVLHDPLSAEEHFQLALTYERKKEYDLALKEYEEVLKKKQFREESYTNMANIYLAQGKAGLAEEFYQKSIRINPSYGKAYNNLAWLYLTQNEKLDQAEQLLLDAINRDPRLSPDFLDTLSFVYEKEGRWDKALETLKKAESAGFDDRPEEAIQFYQHLEKVLTFLGQLTDAAQAHQKMTTLQNQMNQEISAHGH
ncbi:MAG: tetratricopeptide repeat protein [Nitrospirae bacterium]|nr:tetratricopeptide repeat protein [Nitrospirota bacterium]